MDAAVLTGPGMPHFASFPAPSPSAGNSVIDVLVAGLNPVDIAIASGTFPGVTPGYPSVTGHEGIGILDYIVVIEQVKGSSIASRSFWRNRGLMSRSK